MRGWTVTLIVAGAVIIGGGVGYYLSQSDVTMQRKQPKEEGCRPKCAGLQCETSMDIDRIDRLFATGARKLPFMETIAYTHHVPWLKGRSALLNDYARHYQTSSQFIARSLNDGKNETLMRRIVQGETFNVISSDKNIEFYLVVDLSRRFMHLYAYDAGMEERYLLKIYKVGVGSLDPNQKSGCETPLGRYKLSERIGIYKPGVVANVGGRVMELVQLYGTRHIPFGDRKHQCAIQGNPWVVDADTGDLIEMRNFIGQYATEGNIRMHTEDVEELFSIVTSRDTYIEIVRDFPEAHLPGREVDL